MTIFAKVVLALTVIFAYGGYAFYEQALHHGEDTIAHQTEYRAQAALPAAMVQQAAPATSSLVTVSDNVKKARVSAPTPKPISTAAPTPQPIARPRGTFRDGTYTGPRIDVYYGFIQVAAVITNGRLTEVKILTYPDDRDTSVEINTDALPRLTREAITAQSADVSGVSGATETSVGFRESLSVALSQAS